MALARFCRKLAQRVLTRRVRVGGWACAMRKKQRTRGRVEILRRTNLFIAKASRRLSIQVCATNLMKSAWRVCAGDTAMLARQMLSGAVTSAGKVTSAG